jgi:peptide/nickel transport system substrate-binding protein
MTPLRKLASTTLATVLLALSTVPGQADKASDTLTWISRYPIDVIDPYSNTAREATIINSQLVWDTLVWRDPATGEYLPLLATEWSWKDDKTLSFKLRSGVKWHNGEPLTVDDAVATFTRVSSPEAKVGIPANTAWIEGAEKTGEDTFDLKLKRPFPAALEYLSSLLPVLPKNMYGEDGKQAPTVESSVGTGPYRVVSFTPSNSIELEVNPDYFEGSPKGKPSIGKIVNRTVPDNSTQIAELLSGGADWIWNVSLDQAAPMRGRDGIEVVSAETMRQSMITFNVRDISAKNPLQDYRVRQAVAHAIDRQAIVSSMVGEGATIPKAVCAVSQFGCEQDVKQYDYDPELSRKLLAEAGANDLTLDLQGTRNADWTAAVGAYLNAVGIKTTINQLTYAAAQERLANNQSQLYLLDQGFFSINDASAALGFFYMGDSLDSAQDKELTSITLGANDTTDVEKRRALYSSAFKKIADNLYAFPMWTHPNIHAFNSELEMGSYTDENPRFYFAKWK